MYPNMPQKVDHLLVLASKPLQKSLSFKVPSAEIKTLDVDGHSIHARENETVETEISDRMWMINVCLL